MNGRVTVPAIQVNGRQYSLPTRPVVVVCVDGCDPKYLDNALAAGLHADRCPHAQYGLPFDIAHAISTASIGTTDCSARAAAGEAAFRAGRLAWPAAGTARAHRVLRPARGRACGAAAGRVQGQRAAEGGLAAGQAALHRPADRPQAAGAGRDLLQFGVAARSCTAPISTTTSSSCARRYRPSISRPTSRRLPTYRVYYPTPRRCTIPSCASSPTSSSSASSPTSTATSPCSSACARCSATRLRANFQIQVLSSLFFRNKGAYIVGKVINGIRDTAVRVPILHNRAGS